MMNYSKYIGFELSAVKSELEKLTNKNIIAYDNDSRIKDFNKELVVKIKETEEDIIIAYSKFLFK